MAAASKNFMLFSGRKRVAGRRNGALLLAKPVARRQMKES